MNDKKRVVPKRFLVYIALILLWIPACQGKTPAASPSAGPGVSSLPHQIGNHREPRIIEAAYSEVKDIQQKPEKTLLPQTILRKIELSGGALIVFESRVEKDVLLYGFINDKGAFVQIGPIGSEPYLNHITAGEATVFGKSLIWIKGLEGASAIVSDYVEKRNGEVYPFLHLGKDVTIADVDHDGEAELLTQTGNPYSELSILKWREDRLQELLVNRALQAEQGVGYDSGQGVFTAGYANNEMNTYRLDSTTFTLMDK
ncbi:MAG: hypothetical protein K0R57_5538 [Paenibacillaceae bacterium]|jgi:hypothetical protein|nr:hypothetical protein [Paenibacillaceae bacterium]